MANAAKINLPAKLSGGKDWTQGPILRNLWLLSWPMMVTEAMYMISQLFDMVWVGRAGSAAIAGLGIGLMLVFMISVVDMAIISGMRAMIARFVGAGEPENARKVAAQAYILAVSWGLLVTLVGFSVAKYLIGMFGVSPEVLQEGSRYLQVMFAGWISMELHVMGLYIRQAAGDSMSPMITQIIVRSLHLLLCPLLVLGIWIFPNLGITGAALSNVVSQALGGLIGIWFIFGGRSRIKLSWSDIRFSPSITWRILKIGIPSLISMAQMTFSNFILTWIIAPFGTLALAAHSLAGNINGFVSTPSMGMSGGVAVLSGQSLGAKMPQRAVRSTWLGAAILQGFLLICLVVILVWANQIAGFFTSDPALIDIAGKFLRIGAGAYLVMGLATALSACINGAGDTLPMMIINIGMIWLVQLPLAFALSRYTGLEVYGIRIGMVAAPVAAAVATFLYFRFGKWKTKRV
ncbi:MAG TPA: MATE family efflux transporter [Dehalococcoidales bacterium]|nr:MATE family efflux transporter [Dehalococcoidales bacterium]